MPSSSKSSEISDKHVDNGKPDVECVSEEECSPDFVRRTMCVHHLHIRLSGEVTSENRRHIDVRMLPLLGLVYSVALSDRSNLGVARVAGMEKDLVR